MSHRVEYFKGRDNQWRWRIKSNNGNIIAVASEGYKRARDMKRGLLRMFVAVVAGRLKMSK